MKANLTAAPDGIFLRQVAVALLAVYAFSLAFMQPGMRVFGYVVQFSEVVFVVLAIAALPVVIRERQAVLGNPLLVPILLYLAAFLVAALCAENIRFSLTKFLGVAYLGAVAVIAHAVIRDAADLRRVVLAFIAGSTVVALIGTFAVLMFYASPGSEIAKPFLHHYGSLPPGNYPRVESTFLYPAMLCNYLTAAILLLIAVERTGWISRRLVTLAAVLVSITALFTLTPGLAGFILAVCLFYSYRLRETGRKAAARLTAAFGAAVAAGAVVVSALTLRQIPTSPYRFEILGVFIDPTQRLLTWQGALSIFSENPITGRGPGTRAAEVIFLAPSGQTQMLVDAHNTFLNIAATAGAIGLASVLFLCFSVWRVRPESIRSAPVTGALWLAFVSGFIYQGLTGSFEDARHLWLVIGLLPAAAVIEGGKQTS